MATKKKSAGEATAKNGRTRKNIDPHEFVRQWQSGMPIKEMAEHLGVAETTIAAKAMRMRKKGIPLKERSRARMSQALIDELADLAESLA